MVRWQPLLPFMIDHDLFAADIAQVLAIFSCRIFADEFESCLGESTRTGFLHGNSLLRRIA